LPVPAPISSAVSTGCPAYDITVSNSSPGYPGRNRSYASALAPKLSARGAWRESPAVISPTHVPGRASPASMKALVTASM